MKIITIFIKILNIHNHDHDISSCDYFPHIYSVVCHDGGEDQGDDVDDGGVDDDDDDEEYDGEDGGDNEYDEEDDDDDDDGGGGCDDDDLGGWRIGLRRQRMFSAVSGLQLLQQQGEF